jgi:hypothetical protein
LRAKLDACTADLNVPRVASEVNHKHSPMIDKELRVTGASRRHVARVSIDQ